MKKYKIMAGSKMLPQPCSRNDKLETLFKTLCKMDYIVTPFYDTDIDRIILWSAKPLHKFPKSDKKKIILEHGWIPRSTCQISNLGSNMQGHYAQNYQYIPLTEIEKNFTLQYIIKLRKDYKANINKVENFKIKIPDPFILLPFQQSGDLNLKYSNTSFKKYFGNEDKENLLFKQAWVDYLKQYKFPYKLLFKQHPADNCQFLENFLQLPQNSSIILKKHQISIHSIFASGLCKAVISLNSNSIHEALIYNIPVISLDKLIWNDNTIPRPLPKDIKEINIVITTKPLESDMILAYIYHLIKNQWTLEDLKNPKIVRKIIDYQGNCNQIDVKRELGLL